MSKIAERPAFPTDTNIHRSGMTYRQWLVGQVIAGFDANAYTISEYSTVAGCAVRMADAIIAELERIP